MAEALVPLLSVKSTSICIFLAVVGTEISSARADWVVLELPEGQGVCSEVEAVGC